MNKKLPGNHAAKMIIDTAMYDLMAKELGIPLYQILGGKVLKQFENQPSSWDYE